MTKLASFTGAVLALLIAGGVSLTFAEQPVELGLVKWERDLQEAKRLSKKTGKPLFVQFQEVPG